MVHVGCKLSADPPDRQGLQGRQVISSQALNKEGTVNSVSAARFGALGNCPTFSDNLVQVEPLAAREKAPRQICSPAGKLASGFGPVGWRGGRGRPLGSLGPARFHDRSAARPNRAPLSTRVASCVAI